MNSDTQLGGNVNEAVIDRTVGELQHPESLWSRVSINRDGTPQTQGSAMRATAAVFRDVFDHNAGKRRNEVSHHQIVDGHLAAGKPRGDLTIWRSMT
jgi:hypothetical protein